MFLSQPPDPHQDYLPAISYTFFLKQFLGFFVGGNSRISKPRFCCYSFYTLERESREKDLYGSAAQNVIIQFPSADSPTAHSYSELVDSTWVDVSSDVLGCSFPSSLLSSNLLSLSLNQFPLNLRFSSVLLSYLPELLRGFILWEKRIFSHFSGTWKGRISGNKCLICFLKLESRSRADLTQLYFRRMAASKWRVVRRETEAGRLVRRVQQ